MMNSKKIAFALCATLAFAATAAEPNIKITPKAIIVTLNPSPNTPSWIDIDLTDTYKSIRKLKQYKREISHIDNRWHKAIEALKNKEINQAQHDKQMECIIDQLGYIRNCWDPRTWSYQPVFTRCANYVKNDITHLKEIKNAINELFDKGLILIAGTRDEAYWTRKDIETLIKNLNEIENYITSHQRYWDEQPRVSLNRTDVIVWN